MDTAQWPQVVKPMEDHLVGSTCSTKPSSSLEKKSRPQKEHALNCPRCNSTNTKFCYYNNYSLSQPRYFCKTCRRYWTEGGSFRNIPVGGGSRKNKRSSRHSSNSISTPSKKNLDPIPTPSKFHEAQYLNLGFSTTTSQDFKTISELIQVPNFEPTKESSSSNSSQLSALELITGISSSSGLNLNSFFPQFPITTDPSTVCPSGFPLPDFKSTLGFSLDGLGPNGYIGSLQETNGRLLFPFEDLKQVYSCTTSNDVQIDQNRDQNGDSNGFWNGVIGGGSW